MLRNTYRGRVGRRAAKAWQAPRLVYITVRATKSGSTTKHKHIVAPTRLRRTTKLAATHYYNSRVLCSAQSML